MRSGTFNPLAHGRSLGTAAQPSSLPLDFPSRGYRVKGALRASLSRSAFADPGHGIRSTGASSYEEDGDGEGPLANR